MGAKRSKNQIRRERLKLRKVENANEGKSLEKTTPEVAGSPPVKPEPDAQVPSPKAETEAITTEPESPSDTKKDQLLQIFAGLKDDNTSDDGLVSQYTDIFQKFNTDERPQLAVEKHTQPDSESDTSSSEDEQSSELSKRQKRKLHKIPISQLKASTTKPQAVEWFDADAPDPYLVVKLKTTMNYIDVPSHWQQKKDYLSSKRGVERPPFQLPKFIQNTGISEMRGHDPESLKKSQRDRVQPKMGKLDIDYQKLHDAFFKYQTKPRMLAFGEVYSEGREKADSYREKVAGMRPGKISKELRAAVGMPDNESIVPPWVTLMHELGKPPSYSSLIIPGLDVEYTNSGYRNQVADNVPRLRVSQSFWGQLEEGEVSEEESESEAESEAESDNKEQEHEEVVAQDEEDQPERIDITEFSRVKTSEPVTSTSTGSLYKVLQETSVDSTNLVGGKQKYDLGQRVQEEKKDSSPAKESRPEEDFKF